MKKRPMTRGFTLIELLVVIAIIAMLAAGAFTGFGAVMPGVRAKQAAKQLTTINTWLNAFALEGTNNGQFPQGSTANQAFRQLFMGGYGADEMQFYIPNDAYHNTRPNKRPDNDKGQAPDYVQALQPGENAFAYVGGLDNTSDGRLPLIANGFANGSPGIWSRNKNERGGVFEGKKAVVLRVNGSAQAHDLMGGNLFVSELNNGQPVNIFSAQFFGTDENPNILNPE